MTLTIDLAPETEAWISSEAEHLGLGPSQLVQRILDERAAQSNQTETLPAEPKPVIDPKNAAAIAMLDKWLAEGATDDPEEIRKAEEEVAELKRNMNANPPAT